MVRNFGWLSVGILALAIGIVGLLIPIIPGVLFLILAAFCLSAPFPKVRAKFNRHPVARRLAHRWQRTAGLGWVDRFRMLIWSSADLLMSPFARPRKY